MIAIDRPIVFFDLESTGLDIANDRIVQIALAKCSSRLEVIDSLFLLLKPGMPIPPAATAVHGITDSDVASAPTFRDKASQILKFFEGADLGGFNLLRFDIPMLSEEFGRCQMEFPASDMAIVDVQGIFFKKEERTLAAAYQFYCGKELTSAHDAKADIMATIEVFKSQLERYADLGPTLADVHKFCGAEEMVDAARKLRKTIDGKVVFAFGKFKDEAVSDHRDYATWMLGQNFPETTKRALRKLLGV